MVWKLPAAIPTNSGPKQRHGIDPDQPVGQGGHERKSDYILGQFAGVSSETLRRSRFLCNEAPDDIQDALFAGVIAIGTAYKKLQAEKKREQAKEARRLAREAEKPNHSPQEKTLENPEGIVGGEPVYHNGELIICSCFHKGRAC